MAHRRSSILWLGAALLVVMVAWFVVTPRRAWQQFLQALALDNPTALEAVVNYPAVREQAESDLNIAMTRLVKARPGVQARLRDDLVKSMIDSMTSLHGLLQLVNGFSTVSANGKPPRTAFRYHGLSRVDVLLGGTGPSNADAGLFSFERTGLHWRLVRASSQRIAALTPGS